jgi:nucleoside-diphosphate-sugar epimerase
VYLLGHGNYRVNAIHGADLAKFCVEAIASKETDLPIGGPEIHTYREAAESAFKILGKEPRIKTLPGGLPKLLLPLMRPFLSKRKYTSLQFLIHAMQSDAVAPLYGTHTLESFFRELNH